MRNGHAQTLDSLEAAALARLAKAHGYTRDGDVVQSYERVADAIRGEVESWDDIPVERRHALLTALAKAVSKELLAFDAEVKARDGA